jgi:hypothetical protein
VTKRQNDLELHTENCVEPDEIKQYIYDAIDDAEETIIDQFNDFFLTYQDAEIELGDTEIAVPEDIYDLRLRGIYYDRGGFNPDNTTGRWYKIKKLAIENVATVNPLDDYRYRLVNATEGLRLDIFPPFREATTTNVRIWYIRKAIRPALDTDVLERGIKPQYILAHAKVSIMEKEGDPMLDVELQRLAVQTEKMINSISRLTDDDEDSYLEIDDHAMSEAYGGSEGSVW